MQATMNHHAVEAPDSLSVYKINKHIPSVIEKSVLTALSFYPSLKDVHINFKFKKNTGSSIMQAQPVFNTLLLPRSQRTYQINISAMFKLTHAAIPIHQIPENIMIGWIGHELGHIMDYERRSNWNIITFGVSYVLSKRFIKKVEIIADTYAVNYGLGQYIIDTKRFILEHADLPQAYKDKIAELYLSPDDIVEQVRKLEEKQVKKQQENLSTNPFKLIR